MTENKNASFLLQIWIEVEKGVARNGSVLLIYSGDEILTCEKQDQCGESTHDSFSQIGQPELNWVCLPPTPLFVS